MFTLALALLIGSVLAGGLACSRTSSDGPEGVADAFADAYFRLADQQRAKEYTAFGAAKMLDEEIRQVSEVRKTGYTPQKAGIAVTVSRGAKSKRGERVRFDYTIRYADEGGSTEKHADIELGQVHGKWRVVRVGLTGAKPKPSSS